MTTISPYILPGLMKGTVIHLKPVLNKSHLDTIFKAVSEVTMVSPKDICSKVRKDEFVEARQIFCALAKKHTTSTLREIGDKIGYKEHTAVIHCLEVFNALHTTDAKFAEIVRRIEIKII